MLKMFGRLLAVCAVTIPAAGYAAETIINFESFATDPVSAAPLTSNGYRFGSLGGHFHVLDGASYSSNNNTKMLIHDSVVDFFLEAADQSDFYLTGVDLNLYVNVDGGSAISITGYNNGSVTHSFSTGIDYSFDTYFAPNFGAVDRVLFRGANGFGMDNVRLSNTLNAAVPEPATWAMMITGFGMVGGAMRMRRRISYAV